MKSGKFKQIFYNYALAALFACLAVNLINFATSTIGLFTKNHTPTYTKISDSISTGSHEEEAVALTAPEAPTKTIASSYARKVVAPIHTVKATAKPSGDYIIVGGRTIAMVSVNDTNWTPANSAARLTGCRDDACKFIFAHNLPHLFGHLNSAANGEAVTISINGEAHTYRIAKTERIAKAGAPMWSIVRAISSDHQHYAYALMTCVGNGATERDVIYLK